MTNETHNTKPRRRWYQFSLRTLLIVVTLSAVPLGWVGWKVEQGRRQRAVIAWVEKMVGVVGFEDAEEKSWWNEWENNWFGERVRWVNLGDSQVSDISPLAKLKNLKDLSLGRTRVSDLSPLAKLKSLEELHLHDTHVSDLSPLTELKNLESLALSDTQVSDLSPLAELTNLERLYLRNTQVSDLSPLAELENLEVLGLTGTQVSDLSPLAELESLEYLYLPTQVSDEQVQKLRQALPNCEIIH